jgi:hypothetical protein
VCFLARNISGHLPYARDTLTVSLGYLPSGGVPRPRAATAPKPAPPTASPQIGFFFASVTSPRVFDDIGALPWMKHPFASNQFPTNGISAGPATMTSVLRVTLFGRSATPRGVLMNGHTSYAAFVGRVGALAVALGIGVAFGGPAIAAADPTQAGPDDSVGASSPATSRGSAPHGRSAATRKRRSPLLPVARRRRRVPAADDRPQTLSVRLCQSPPFPASAAISARRPRLPPHKGPPRSKPNRSCPTHWMFRRVPHRCHP